MSSPMPGGIRADGPISGLEDSGPIAEEVGNRPLVDVIVDFDPLPYLNEPLREIWLWVQDYPMLFATILVALGYAIGRLLKWLVHVVMDRIAKSHISEADYEIAHFLAHPILSTMVTLSLVLALATLDFPGAIEHLLIKVCFTVLLLFWGRAWFRATRVILEALEAERDRFHMFQPRTVPLYEMSIKLFLIGVFVYLFFIIWGINATAWVASAGIIGIVVGFAARDTLANLIAGVSIVADAPYKIGDFIKLETGERGLVTHLGIRSTRILTRDDIELCIPNAVIGASKVTNESGGPWVRHRIRIPIGVAYSSDMDKVIEVLKDVAAHNDGVEDNPHPRVRARSFDDNAINVELLCWIRNPATRGPTVHQLILSVIRRFREEGIEIPFPQRDLHVKDGLAEAFTEELANAPDHGSAVGPSSSG